MPDLSRMEELLGLMPKIELRDGIGRLWDWYWRLPRETVELLEG
jgi:nucleoside-diphosphate-sugar epimerase